MEMSQILRQLFGASVAPSSISIDREYNKEGLIYLEFRSQASGISSVLRAVWQKNGINQTFRNVRFRARHFADKSMVVTDSKFV